MARDIVEGRRELLHVDRFPRRDLSGDLGVIDMDALSVMRLWTFRDNLPVRDGFTTDWLSRNTTRNYPRAVSPSPSSNQLALTEASSAVAARKEDDVKPTLAP
ncbi:hypothetical protein [Rhodobacter aestuarii]|nr:hypothetical protein [Rhodobacter aestuarii]